MTGLNPSTEEHHTKKYYARVSCVHPTLPLSELKALAEMYSHSYEVVSVLDGHIIFEAASLNAWSICDRAAYVKSIGVLLGVSEADKDSLEEHALQWASALKSMTGDPISIKVYRVKGYSRHLRRDYVKKLLLNILRRLGASLDPSSPKVLEVGIAEGAIIAGLLLCKSNPKRFMDRSPGRRPFFKPGPLDARLTRALVNIARAKEQSTFLDPFCGTGGFAIEACTAGIVKVLCGDLDPVMSKGSRLNLDHYGCRHVASYCGDAVHPPLGWGTVDSIATDPPYGKSTSTGRRELRGLYSSFLRSAYHHLRPGGYLIFAGPKALSPHKLAAETGFEVVETHYMYVHGGLTRVVVVSRKPEA